MKERSGTPSSGRISQGDMVVVVKPRRCGFANTVGNIFIAGEIVFSKKRGRCVTCNAVTYPRGTLRTTNHKGNCIEVDRLKRIPPLDELEGERTKEDIREPA